MEKLSIQWYFDTMNLPTILCKAAVSWPETMLLTVKQAVGFQIVHKSFSQNSLKDLDYLIGTYYMAVEMWRISTNSAIISTADFLTAII